ncbi:uncharacterized protein LOC123302845 [Chrysoperla carnea]|uniref:uncharacterized protein LOC123302845 n=1 Tax=Chrysoperla carnea TaxID=189513 RepID=UPI001D07F619|nr:uncharacterized protein LOC123302845 [Chrysoperla carnea]
MELGENSQNLREKSSYKYCFVPQCKNTSKSTPEKLFISVPKGDKRAKWVKQVRCPLDVSATSRLHCFEDHFDLQNDLKNHMRVKLDPNANILLKDDVLPTLFDCQSDRKRAWTSTERPGAKKLRHARTLAEIEEDLVRSISLTSAGAVGETTVDESTTASSTSDFFPLDTSGSSAITEVGTRSLDVHINSLSLSDTHGVTSKPNQHWTRNVGVQVHLKTHHFRSVRLQCKPDTKDASCSPIKTFENDANDPASSNPSSS